MPISRMRPSAFQALSVGRWVCQSTRLWICIRSIVSVRSSLHRLLHLRDARVAAVRPDLGGEEGLVARAGVRPAGRRPRLGAAVHRRAVDHRAAGLEQHLQHLGARRALGRRRRRHRRSARCRSRPPAAARRSTGSCGCACGAPVCASGRRGRAGRRRPDGGRRSATGVMTSTRPGNRDAAPRDVDRRPFTITRGACGKSRDREALGQASPAWSGFAHGRSSTSRDHGRYSSRSRPTLPSALKLAPSRVVSVQACGSGSGL